MAVTLAQARQHLNFDPDDVADDDELTFFVQAANEWIAHNVSDTTPTPVQLGTLELIRHWWETQRGPGFSGGLSDDTDAEMGLRGFAIPNRVRELISPWAVGTATGVPAASFPAAACWPDPISRTVW